MSDNIKIIPEVMATCQSKVQDAVNRAGDQALVYSFFVKQFLDGLSNKTSLLGYHVNIYNARIDDEQNASDGIVIKTVFSAKSDNALLLLHDFSVIMTFPRVILKPNVSTKDVFRHVKHTIARGFSGWLSSPYETEQFMQTQQKVLNLTDNQLDLRYQCDECKIKYKTASGLLRHLIKTKHTDSLSEQYGYFEPKYAEFFTKNGKNA